MANLLKRIEARMTDPKLNSNFNREVSSKKNDVSVTDKSSTALATEAFQEYKKQETNGCKTICN